MKMVLLLIFLIIFETVIICFFIYLLLNEKNRSKGVRLYAAKREEKVLPGQPTRYIVTVEMEENGKKIRKKIVTADKNILRDKQNEQLPVIYIEATGKVYWADERKGYRLATVGILAAMGMNLFFIIIGVIFAMYRFV